MEIVIIGFLAILYFGLGRRRQKKWTIRNPVSGVYYIFSRGDEFSDVIGYFSGDPGMVLSIYHSGDSTRVNLRMYRSEVIDFTFRSNKLYDIETVDTTWEERIKRWF